MTAALLLASLAAATGMLGARLDRAHWPARLPKHAIVIWQALSWCFVTSVLLAGLALAVPSVPWGVDGLAGFVGACAALVRDHYATPGGAAAGGVGLLVVGTVVSSIGVRACAEVRMLRRARARQRSAVTLVADHDERADVWLLEEPRPAAYVLPGRVPMIVVTTGAVADLHDGELRAVLAHERAHVDGRHDIAITVARILHRALPGVPLLAAAAREVPRLLEMHADDRAAQAHGRRALATALARLAGALRPGTEATPVTLRSTGGDAAARVERMTDAARRGRCWQRCALGAVALVLLLAPLALAAAPAVEAAVLDYCPVPLG